MSIFLTNPPPPDMTCPSDKVAIYYISWVVSIYSLYDKYLTIQFCKTQAQMIKAALQEMLAETAGRHFR